MSFAKGLLGGSKPKAVSTSTVQVPDWLDTRNQSLAARAETLSNQGFTPYTGQRVANLTPDAQQAFNLQRTNVGRFNDLLGRATEGSNQLFTRAQGPTSADIQSRMNPFIQNVLDIERRGIYEDFDKQNQDLRRQAGMVGAFGGSRMAIQEAEARKNLGQLLSDTNYRGLFDGFNQAQGQFNRDTDVLSNAIGQSLGTIEGGQRMNEGDILGLIRSDAIQRERDQAQLDFNYDEFDRQQATPFDNLAFYANILNPLTSGYTGGQTTSQQKGGSGSKLGNALGMASSIASIAGLFSDERLKENIEKVGELDNGLPVYKYNFKGDPTVQIGVLAQEVEDVKPEAVMDDESGFKKVDYDQATQKFAQGGYVNTRTAQAKRQPIKQIRSPNLPSAQLPQDDGNDITGLMQSGQLEKGLTDLFGLFKKNPMTSNIPAVFGTGYSDAMNIGSKMFTFKDGGSPFRKLLEEEKANRDLRYSMTPKFELDPQTQSIAGLVGRGTANAVNQIPAFIANLPSYGRSLVGEGLDAAYPAYKATFETPAAQVLKTDSKKQLADATRKMEVPVEDDILKAEVENLRKSRGKPTAPPQGNEQVMLPPMLPPGANLDAATQNAAAVNQPASLQIPEGLPEFMVGETNTAPAALQVPGFSSSMAQQDTTGQLAQQQATSMPSFEEFLKLTRAGAPQEDKPKEEESKINYPLLAFGLQMLSTDGDFGDQLGAGSEALFKTLKNIDEQKRADRELDIRAGDEQQQLMNQYIEYLKALAYMEQAQNRGSGMDIGDMIQWQRLQQQINQDRISNKFKWLESLPPHVRQSYFDQMKEMGDKGLPTLEAPTNPLDDLDLSDIGR